MEQALTPEQQAVQQASRNIMLELNLRQQALERATSYMYEATPYEVTKVAETFLQFLQTGVAVEAPTTEVATNE